jgi:hypothetical protein
MLKDKKPGSLGFLMEEPDEDHNMCSGWTAMNEKHKRTCPIHKEV